MSYTTGGNKSHSRPGAYASRDWSALEKRLNETRELLKDILSNLQVVLQNLRNLNRQTKARAQARGAAEGKPKSAFGQAGAETFARAKREYHGPYGHTGQSAKPGASHRAGPSSSDPGGYGQSDRGAHNPYGRTQNTGAQAGPQTGSRSDQHFQAGQSARSASGPRPGGPSGNETGQGSQGSTGARPGSQSAGGARASGAGSQSTGRQYRSQAGSSRREYRRPLRPRGDMTIERARAILSVTSARNVGDIKSAYRKKARQYHPDLGGDEEMMKDLNIAYDMLLQYHFSHHAPTERRQ